MPRPPSPWTGHVWISGAGSGIGKELAIAAAPRAAALSLVDINTADARAVAASLTAAHPALAVSVFGADVSDYSQVQAAVDGAVKAHEPITVLCANAGVPCSGLFCEVAPEHGKKMFDINYFGVQHTLAAALPAMAADFDASLPPKQRPRRAVLVSASAATHLSQPAAAHYSAAKYAVRGFLNSLRSEYHLLRHLSFHILAPWYVDTPMIARAHGTDPSRTPTLKAVQEHFIKHDDLIPPSQVARAAMRGVDKGTYTIATDPLSRLFADIGYAAGEPTRLPFVVALLASPFMVIANAVVQATINQGLDKVLAATPPPGTRLGEAKK